MTAPVVAAPIDGAAVGVGADHASGVVELRLDLPGHDRPLRVLLSPELASQLAGMLSEAAADLD